MVVPDFPPRMRLDGIGHDSEEKHSDLSADAPNHVPRFLTGFVTAGFQLLLPRLVVDLNASIDGLGTLQNRWSKVAIGAC